MADLPQLLKTALQLRAETDISQLFLPAMSSPNHSPLTDHEITPPPELTDVWKNLPLSDEEIFVIAARWGSDQELEACCKWMTNHFHGMKDWTAELRAARRPKPPSLKDEAVKALRSIERGLGRPEDTETLRRALEQLDD